MIVLPFLFMLVILYSSEGSSIQCLSGVVCNYYGYATPNCSSYCCHIPSLRGSGILFLIHIPNPLFPITMNTQGDANPASGGRPAVELLAKTIMVCPYRESERARAYPPGDAQGQHPASVGNGQGLSHQSGWVRRKRQARNDKEVRLRFASWNVGTMTGRGRELADVLKRRRINVACLQETKWKGSKAREIGEGYKFFYCGSDGKRNGVGIVLDSTLKESVIEVKRVSDRVIKVKVMLENLILNVISVYAPQTGCDDRMKDKFWEEFDSVVTVVPENEEMYVGGDFNGHVGKMSNGYERVHGGWGWGSRNEEGEALLQAALAFDLAITNTWFQKNKQHLISYKSGRHTTQIDYFLVKRSKINWVKNCKVLPGESIVTQHRLLILEIKCVVTTNSKKQRPPPRIKWKLLDRTECANEFRSRVIGKMLKMDSMQDISVNECWREMAGYVRATAREVMGMSKGKSMISKETWWWNEEVQKALKEKKRAFKAWQSEVEDGDLKEEKKQMYRECKKRAKVAVAVARTNAQDELYRSLDSPDGEKQLYRIAKQREKNTRDMAHVKCIKDNLGRVLVDDVGIKERWKGYFETLMNEENVWNGILDDVPVNTGLVREVSMSEVKAAVQGMKNGKAVGPDEIPVEVWKTLGMDGYKWLALFFNKLLHEESIPEEWCNSTLVPMFKNKGDVQDCNNYRGIKLMSHSMKVWERVIERRLREESEITGNQFGFMPGRGTADATFALRLLCEKYRLAHKNLHMVFVDLEKAYDRVPRKVLWWALKEKGVPGKYVELIRAMYNQSCTQVRSAAGITEKFGVAVGLHQGSALSPYLFLLLMDALTSDIQEEAPWCMLFADDIVLVGEEGTEVQCRLEKWQRGLEGVGLKISRTKTEYMFCDFGGPSSPVPIALDGVALPVCTDFRYLGSLIQADGGIDRAVNRRINAGWMKWRQVTGTICDSRMPLRLKGKIYKTVVRPVVMYGSECYGMKKSDERRMHVAEMRMLRWMCGVTRMDRVRNEYVRGSLKVASIIDKMRGTRLSWYGHVMRREECHVTRRMLSLEVDGYKGRGRPKKRWMDCLKDDMRIKDVTSGMAKDRVEWRKKTHCADPN